MDNISFEYVAGFFDAEGCVSLVKQKAASDEKSIYGFFLTPRVCVVQKDKKLLEKINEFCSSFGCGGYIKIHSKIKDTYMIAWDGMKRARNILEKITPFLIIKYEEASLILNFIHQRLLIDKRKPYSEYQLSLVEKLTSMKYPDHPVADTEITPMYLGGFIDGDGCLRLEQTFRKEIDYFRITPQILLTQRNRPFIYRLQEYFENLGIRTTIKSLNNQEKAQSLRISSLTSVFATLLLVGPYIIHKVDQVVALRSYVESRLERPHGRYKESEIDVVDALMELKVA
jgi:intein/homing endonuclease